MKIRSAARWLFVALVVEAICYALWRTHFCPQPLDNFSLDAWAQMSNPPGLWRDSALLALGITAVAFFSVRRRWLTERALVQGGLVAILLLDPRALAFPSRAWWGVFRAIAALFLLTAWWRAAQQRPARVSARKEYALHLDGLGRAALSSLPIYLALFVVIAFPMIREFDTHVYADGGDGMQMLWNVWWFNKALRAGLNPFFTSYLYYPMGSTLLGASYHPLKALLVTPLVPLLGLAKAYNVLFIGTFVACSVAAFCLSFALTGSFGGALLAGFVFGFWNNRFAQANGHMHVMSSEFVPLFLLSLLAYCHSPSIKRATIAALVLFASLLVDHYSFLCNGFLLLGVACWEGYQNRELLLLGQRMRKSGIVFCGLSALTCGSYLFFMLRANHQDPWIGSHGAIDNSMDVFALFVPSAFSWLGKGTAFFWQRIRAGVMEGSVFVGLLTCVLALIGQRVHAKVGDRGVRSLLFFLLASFFVLALGPYLQIWGWVTPFSLPYLFLQKTIKPLQMSGMPVRLSVVVALLVAIFASFTLAAWLAKKRYALAGWAALLVVVETLPILPARTRIEVPAHVAFLKTLAADGGLVDDDSFFTTALYYQTVHEKPLAFGYIARTPISRVDYEARVHALVQAHDFGTLRRQYGLKYLNTGAGKLEREKQLRVLYADKQHVVFEMLSE